MAKVQKIWAREILDSRANPTVEAYCLLDNGIVAISSVPSGISTGTYEAHELRDGDPKRYKGKGVLKAVENVTNILGPAIIGMDPNQQEEIDKKMMALDGTENKEKLGANSILSISEVVAKAAALDKKEPLFKYFWDVSEQRQIPVHKKIPTPLFNMINGGLHGAGNLDFQEFFVIPASSKSFSQGLEMGVEIYLSIGENLARRGAIHSVGDEGGYAPNLFTNADALEILVESIRETSYVLGSDVFLGLDVAANSIYKNGRYSIRDKSGPLDELAMIDYFKELNFTYHLEVLEDPLYEDAWTGWNKLLQTLDPQMSIVGDDLLVTNPKRIDKAIAQKACNTILVKPNQIGTVTETLEVVKKARDAGWKVIVSHRSGETTDTFLADFAVGVGADYIKSGAPARGERVVKYNRLSAIESDMKQMGVLPK
ncbi:MAG TPA: phosphopyruvate hydratase [Patescibacteria group bacterium]|nr:phosphopyruvate hydratase [Patescibacteria group bacterium]